MILIAFLWFLISLNVAVAVNVATGTKCYILLELLIGQITLRSQILTISVIIIIIF